MQQRQGRSAKIASYFFLFYIFIFLLFYKIGVPEG